MNRFINTNNKAFTLIELLIVVSVIGILSGITLRVINPQELNKKSRDSQRVVDVKKIQTALELYYLDFRTYPDKGTLMINGSDELSKLLVDEEYIDNIPVDPSDLGYEYQTIDKGKSYKIKFATEFELTDNCDSSPFGSDYGCTQFSSPF